MWRRRKGANEGGSVIVESAIVFPVLFAVVFGAIEYGLLFKDDLTGSNVVRAGGRVLSAQANSLLADQIGLQAMIPAAAAFDDGLSSVSRVVVYMATCANPAAYSTPTTPRCGANPPIKRLAEMTNAAACTDRTSTVGLTDRCNVYSGSQLTQAFANTSSNFGCDPGDGDVKWCPSRRLVSQSVGTDYVGVHIEYTHDWVTGLFGASRRLTDDVVFRLEPQGA